MTVGLLVGPVGASVAAIAKAPVPADLLGCNVGYARLHAVAPSSADTIGQ
jgi:hypothetical protein